MWIHILYIDHCSGLYLLIIINSYNYVPFITVRECIIVHVLGCLGNFKLSWMWSFSLCTIATNYFFKCTLSCVQLWTSVCALP